MTDRFIMGLCALAFVFISSITPLSLLANDEDAHRDPTQDILPASPTAAALERYGEIPVSHYSGIPQVSVPIHNLTGRSISVPISLNYNAGGVRVDDLASWVGLGWSLSAGGTVSRTVRGKPDEEIGGYQNDYIPYPFVKVRDAARLEESTYPSSHFDGQPDIFSYNFGAYSGKFFVDRDGTVKTVPFQNFKIVTAMENGSLGTFEITTPEGKKYTFGGNNATEWSRSFSTRGQGTRECPKDFPDNTPTSWHLTKIEDLNTGDVVTFSYEAYTIHYLSRYNETHVMPINSGDCVSPYSQTRCTTIQKVFGKQLRSIETAYGSIEFLTEGGRQDMLTTAGSPHRLKSILIKDKAGNELKRFELEQSFITAAGQNPTSTNYRMLLNSVQEMAGAEEKPPHVFSYYKAEDLPARISFSQDHWGYYNGKNNVNFTPNDILADKSRFVGANREADANFSNYGSLEAIQYPTGGCSLLEMEPNDYKYCDWEDKGSLKQEAAYANLAENTGSSVSKPFSLSFDQDISFSYEVHSDDELFGALVQIYDDEGNVLFLVNSSPGKGEVITGEQSLYLPAGDYTFEAEVSNTEQSAQIFLSHLEPAPIYLTNKIIGGLRVSRISSLPKGGGKPMIKEYRYESKGGGCTGASSGVLLAPAPRYHSNTKFTVKVAEVEHQHCGYRLCNKTIVGSSNVHQASNQSGNIIGYREVLELYGLNGENGKTWQEYSVFRDLDPELGDTPNEGQLGSPKTDMSWKSGKLLKKETYKRKDDGSFVVLASEENDYELEDANSRSTIKAMVTSRLYTAECPRPYVWVCSFEDAQETNTPCHGMEGDTILNPRFFDEFSYEYYDVISQWVYLKSSTTKVYDENGQNPVVNETFYEYNRINQSPNEVRTTASDGTEYIGRTKYIIDYEEDADLYQTMLDKFMVNTPIESSQWIKKPGGSEVLIGASLTEFKDFGGFTLPHVVHKLETTQPSSNFEASSMPANGLVMDSRYRPLGMMDYEQGNLVSYQAEGGQPTSIRWTNNLPTVKTSNASSQEATYSGFENGIPPNWWKGNSSYHNGGRTGNKYLHIPTGQGMGAKISPDEKGQGKTYLLSAWVKQGQGTLRLRLSDAADASGGYYPASFKVEQNIDIPQGYNEYQLVQVAIDLAAAREEYNIPSSTQLNIHASVTNTAGYGLKMDDVRLHPSDALMTTVNYAPNTRLMTSMVNENHIPAFFEYDDFLRFKAAYDQDKNLVAYHDYHYKGVTSIENYVRSVNLLVPGKNIADILDGDLDIDEKQEIFQYLDGLGRPVQTVAYKQSPSQNNVVQITEYDEFGRSSKQYLPYTIASSNAGYRPNAKGEQADFYHNGLFYANTNKPYAETLFEASPLNRPKEQGVPGEDWQIGEGHTQSMSYGSNVANEVYNFSISSNFAANQLMKEIVTDEQGRKNISFKDKLGRVIQTQRQIEGGWAKTAYAYDDLGNLVAVFPPSYVEAYPAAVLSGPVAMEALEKYAYRYQYDARKRMVAKKIPGADWVYYVYDKLDRPILTQDGNNRTDDLWQFTKYDVLGRPIMTGLTSIADTRANIQNQINLYYNNEGNPNFELRDTGNHGYSNRTVPLVQATDEVLTVTYYDDYDFDRDETADFVFINDNEFSGEVFHRLQGQLTGSKVRILGTDDWLHTVTFYDDRGRVLQVQADNHLGGSDITHSEYDFPGRVLKTKRLHQVPTQNEITIRERFDYDHSGRVLNAYYKIDEDAEIRLSNSQYNELDQLIEKNLHSTNFASVNQANYLQSVDYKYNIRGWLERINDVLVSSYVEDAEVALMENGQVSIEFNLAEANETGSSDNKTSSTIDVKHKDGSMTTEQKTSGDSLSTYTTTVVLDLSDLSIDENSLSQSLQILRSRAEAALQNEGVTNSQFMDAMVLELHRTFRDDWLRVRANDDNDDLFSMRLNYNEANTGLNAVAQFNGNISSALWQVKGEAVKAYGYQYDELDRLLNAKYASISSNEAGWQYQEVNRYGVSLISYDLNGNILGLKREGMNDGQNNLPVFGNIDHLSYVYKGNQLTAVTDQSGNDHGFKDGAQQATEYNYDPNGNMIEDKNKGITIDYNHLNLPKKVTFSPTRWLEWDYDAAGIKLSKRVYDNSILTSTKDYLGGMEYSDGALEAIYHAEGRLVPKSENNGPVIGTSDAYSYEYTLKDHLGNSRVMFSDLDENGVVAESEILQVEAYYPFGLGHEGLGNAQVGVENAYGYNGKELNGDFGLDWNDYGARWYMADIGRWGAVDPLAEKYVGWSEYNYVMGNPLKFIDPDGRSVWIHYNDENDKKQKVEYKDQKFYNKNGEEVEVDNQFANDVASSIEYVREADVTGVIDYLTKSKKKVKIKEGQNTEYQGGINTIDFNSREGSVVVEAGEVLGFVSPALKLLHELGHAKMHFANPKAYMAGNVTPDEEWGTFEEGRVINEVELPAAKILGEGERTDSKHHDNYPTISPTTTKPDFDKMHKTKRTNYHRYYNNFKKRLGYD